MFKWFRKETDVKALEKELATLASKINKHEASLSQLKANARRYKGAMSLYMFLFYSIYLAVWALFLAKSSVKDRKWVMEAIPVFVGPVLIYLFRTSVSAYYTRRIANEDDALETLKTQQKEKIEEFKTKTDFYTTKSLIDRYSGTDASQAQASKSPSTPSTKAEMRSETPQSATRGREMPQAQIRQSPRLQVQSQMTPQRSPPQSLVGTIPTPQALSGTPGQSNHDVPKIAEFAPNAEYVLHNNPGPRHWYDRMLDIIVGEDEGNENSRYKLEQKIREREERIAGLEVELMKLRRATLSPATQSKEESPVDISTGEKHDPDDASASLRPRKSQRTKKQNVKSGKEQQDDEDENDEDAA